MSIGDVDPEDYTARHTDLAEQRSAGSVAPSATRPDGQTVGPWTALGHGAVTQALREIDVFFGAVGGGGAPDEQILQWIPEPRHSQIRRALVGAIAPNRLAWVEELVRDVARRQVAAAVASGQVDIVAALADPVPTQTLAALFGVPSEDGALFQRLSDELLERQAGASAGTPLGSLHAEFAEYVDRLVATRRSLPVECEDIVTALLGARCDGEQLSDVSVRTQVMMLIIAGSETTRNLIGNLLCTLASQPLLFERLRKTPSLIDAAVDESLRRDSPIQLLMRTCSRDTELDGTQIAAGEMAIVHVGSANRDEQVFACPADFVLPRDNVRRHLAFGTGPHVCPGAGLARMEARVVLQELLAVVTSMTLAADHEVSHQEVFWAHGKRSAVVDLVAVAIDPDS